MAYKQSSDSWTNARSGVKRLTEIVELYYLLLDFIIPLQLCGFAGEPIY
ncbi:hypothetical protein NIES4075_69650 [Tolypothrix sp. NIES-4075]|nr:hypothetical protein NIES4075_69650 [Tolypothrix sp. NIES-4075]